MRTSTLTAFGSMAAAAAGFVFANRSFSAPQPAGTAPRPAATPARPVTQPVVEAGRKATEAATEPAFIGVAGPARRTQVSSPTQARLEFVVEAGEAVKKDQVIARLNTSVLDAKLATARQAARDESGINAAKARLDQAREELARLTKAEAGAFASHEVAKQKSVLAVADADWVRAVEARKLAQRRAEEIEAEIDEHQIMAPHDGIVSKVWHGAGEQSQVGSPILELVQIDELSIRIECPASAHGRFTAGRRALVRFEGQDAPVPATVARQVMQVNAITGTLWIKLRCPNADGRLPVGGAVSVSFAGNGKPTTAPAGIRRN